MNDESASEAARALSALPEQGILEQIAEVWTAGGVLMVPLFLLAAFIYFYALQVLLYFGRPQHTKVPESVWFSWVQDPAQGHGPIGEMIRYSQSGTPSMKLVKDRFSEIKSHFLPTVDRRIIFIAITVTAAPLLGLLGTVTGMLATFKGLASAQGQVIDTVADGISEALITTQTGLIIAVPGYIFVYVLTQKRRELAAFLETLETTTLQKFSRGEPKPPSQPSSEGASAS